MRPLRDIRLSRSAMTLVVVVSALATYVILSGGGQRSSAQVAALAALREPAGQTRTVVTAPAPAPSNADAGTTGNTGNTGNTGSTTSTSASSTGAGNRGASSGNTGSPAGNTGSGSGNTGSGNTGSDSGNTGSGSGSSGSTTSGLDAVDAKLPKVKHVFVISLSTTAYSAAFGSAGAPYLRSLAHRGTLLSGYQSLGSSELADELALVSGQPPNADTRAACATYQDFAASVVANKRGLVPGSGCVYPETALTIGDQVSAGGHVWRAYLEDMGTESCVHPNSDAVDDVALTGAQPGYDTRHNPFIYFHSLLDLGDCSSDDLDLSKLPSALSSHNGPGAFTYIAPSACADARAVSGDAATNGSTTTSSSTSTSPTTVSPTVVSGAMGVPTAAACPTGPVGIAAENAFLQTWVPKILRSPAYRSGGVLVIALAGDGLHGSGPRVRTGALVLSRYTRAGKTIPTAYTPYSLLRSVEDMLRFTPLADAAKAPSFAADVLSKLTSR